MNHAHVLKAALLLAALLFATIAVYAQSDYGTISGFIKDPSGAVIPNARVVIKNEATGVERAATTNESGYYIVTNLLPGYYTVTAEAASFKKHTSSKNKLDPNSTLAIEAILQIGAAAETIEVTAAATTLQSESAAVQKLVTREQIDGLELNGRNPIFLAQLQPGVIGGTLAGLNMGLSNGPNFINGSRVEENLVTFDGTPAIRTRANGTSIGVADVDSTQEVQVLTANYGAEYGRTSGGQVRIITKTGGRNFHGAAYEYLRNTNLNSNTWARNTNPATAFTAPTHYNQFGFNAGGPFYIPNKFNNDKSKIFWYWGEEWVKYHYTDMPTFTVPSMAMRNGDFSELLSPSNPYYGKTVVIKDPNTGVAFPNNVIPTQVLSPSGIGILRAYPQPNVPGGFILGNVNALYQGMHPVDTRKDTNAVDMNLTDHHRLAFRRQGYHYIEYQPFDQGLAMPKTFNRPNQTNALSYVWTISPTKVNEVLVSAALDGVYMPVDLQHYTDRSTAGIKYPYIFPVGKMVPNRVPTVTMSPFYQLSGGPYPSHSGGPIYNISDSFTWIKGRHTLKFGFLYEKSGENDNDEINVSGVPQGTNNQNGQFTFSDTRSGFPTTGAAVANAALGLFDSYYELGQRAYTIFRGAMYEWFVQDGWKVTSKLHVDVGIRHTINIPYSALWRNMAVFDPAFYDPSKAVKQDPKTGFIIPGSGDPYNGVVIPGSGWPSYAKGRVVEASSGQYDYLFRGIPARYSDIQMGDFGPRLGIAYQVTSKTVVRAGTGRFFTRLGVSDSIFLGGNPPFQPMVGISFGNVDNPGGTAANQYPLVMTTQSKAFRNPEAWNWNMTVERQLPWNSVVSVGYVGRRGLHLQREFDLNQPPAGTLQANPGVNLDYLRPYKGYASIRKGDNVASSRYNSMQVAWNRRFASGLMFGFSYTLAKSMDDGSKKRDIIPDTYDAHMLWGPSEMDARHSAIANYLYNLPFFKGQKNLPSKLLGGWQISGLNQFQTGYPCGVAGSTDYAGTGQAGNMQCAAGQYWVVNGNPALLKQFAAGGSKDPAQWFAVKNGDGSSIFTAPPNGTFNTQKVRGLIYNPGYWNWNLGLFKQFPIRERTGLQFRAEAYNVLNHPNWGGATFNPTSSTFGKVTSKSSERNLQLSLRYYF
jgi:hypothetical protein